MDRFYRLVVIEDRRRVETRRNVGSVQEAAECLIGSDWPRPGGARHRAAAEACLQALAGEISPEAARQAFIAAAREAGILIGEAPGAAGEPPTDEALPVVSALRSTQGLPAHNERDQPAMSEASRAERRDEPFSPLRDILMVMLLPAVIVMALLAVVIVVYL